VGGLVFCLVLREAGLKTPRSWLGNRKPAKDGDGKHANDTAWRETGDGLVFGLPPSCCQDVLAVLS
jgi:hypothetical protein